MRGRDAHLHSGNFATLDGSQPLFHGSRASSQLRHWNQEDQLGGPPPFFPLGLLRLGLRTSHLSDLLSSPPPQHPRSRKLVQYALAFASYQVQRHQGRLGQPPQLPILVRPPHEYVLLPQTQTVPTSRAAPEDLEEGDQILEQLLANAIADWEEEQKAGDNTAQVYGTY